MSINTKFYFLLISFIFIIREINFINLQVYGGMRGMKSLVTETSHLDPEDGIEFRDFTIHQLKKLLPKVPDGEQPLPEGLFWLLCTEDIPTEKQVFLYHFTLLQTF